MKTHNIKSYAHIKASIKNCFYAFVLAGASLILFCRCEKDNDKDSNKFPVVSTNEITGITKTTAVSGGNIINKVGSTVTSRGVVWSTTKNPKVDANDGITTDDLDSEEFISSITGLTPKTTYYVRAYATNSHGTGYGNQVSFETAECSIIYGDGVKDIENNAYKTVIIVSQEWIAENLRTTKYNDGNDILTGHSNAEWENLSTGAYAIFPHTKIDEFNSDAMVLEAYGALYNWYAINTGKLCPKGWRIPTDDDMMQLIYYVDTLVFAANWPRDSKTAGSMLKSSRTAPDNHPRWENPNENAADEYGFSALPGGLRGVYGAFGNVGIHGYWWSASESEYGKDHAWFWEMGFDYDDGFRGAGNKQFGFSVRCLKE